MAYTNRVCDYHGRALSVVIDGIEFCQLCLLAYASYYEIIRILGDFREVSDALLILDNCTSYSKGACHPAGTVPRPLRTQRFSFMRAAWDGLRQVDLTEVSGVEKQADDQS